MTDDNSIPRNLTDSLFRDIQLPQASKIQRKVPATSPAISLTQSKYQQSSDNDVIMLQLGEQSKVIPKTGEKSGSINSIKSKSTQEQYKPPTKTAAYSKIVRKRGAKKAEPQPPKEIDIDNQIGEVAEWAEKGVFNNEDEDDFNQAQKVGQTSEQQQIRRKLEEKLKNNGFGQKSRGGGLQAKAQQLRRQNQVPANQSKPTPISKPKLQQQKVKKQVPKPVITEQVHETSTQMLMGKQKQKKPKLVVQNEQAQQDPWQKVNQNTLNQHNAAKQKRKNMNVESVIKFYKEQFQFDEADIQLQDQIIQKQVKKEEESCFQMLFSCFKTQSKTSKNKNFNIKIAKRLIAISRKQLSNGQQQFFILKQIWTRLTKDVFSRYGWHWNKIGFQGRDPATDLRSTGILSILQWLLFIEDHPALAQKYSKWSIQNQFPLALVHIKTSGVFLDLLEKGVIRCEKWQDFQRAYNALIIGIINKILNQFKTGDTLGSLVEEEARNIKQSYGKQFESYQIQYKK